MYRKVYLCCMTKAECTRRFIAEKTAPLFNSKGFDGTSLTDLTNATGLTKGALYGNFSGKEEIALEAFRYSINKVRELARLELEDATSYKKQLLALLTFYAKYVLTPPVPGGCPLLNTAIEADDHHTFMRSVVASELRNTVDFISDLLKKGIQSGEFIRGIKTKEIAYTLFCAVEGALMFSRVERSREPMDIIVRHCKKIIKQISQ